MLNLNNLKLPKGAKKKRKVVGRGSGSGHGKTSCRGQKGQKSRTGKTKRPGFEGGQMPLIRRIPKRGFTSKFKQEYQIVNLGTLNRCRANTTVGPEELLALGIINRKSIPIKILGEGELKKTISLRTHKISESARKAIEDLGGKVEILELVDTNAKKQDNA